MPIIIGCSGSTGSSLLKTILNRHSQIFSGPETCLFAFPQVYEDWNAIRHQLLDTVLTDGWVIRRGMNLLQKEYAWEKTDLQKKISQATNFKAFVQTFFEKPLQQEHKTHWVEKTPVNAYGFQAFLSHYPDGKVIQIIRNPYDTVASLVARGMNPYYAAGYYVYNTAIATSCNADPRYYQLKYEDLVAQPIATLEALFQFLNIPFEQHITKAKNEQRTEPTTMKGWKHHETATVQASSIGRFQELTEQQKALIQTALLQFQIHPAYTKKHQICFDNCLTLCRELKYDFQTPASISNVNTLKKYYWKDRLSKVRHKGIKALLQYPGRLRR